jgi:hypothetical protein
MKLEENVYKSYRTAAPVEMSRVKTSAVGEGDRRLNFNEIPPPYWQ